jgi:UDP-N-acetylmuramoyl-tripeptide--D-alanyl-D-alanine ligase
VITNIGLCHIEFLKTQENIFRAKSEILTYLKHGDTAIVNAEDPYLRMLQSDVYEIIGVGIEHGTLRAYDIRNTNDEVSFRVDICGNAEPFRFIVPEN